MKTETRPSLLPPSDTQFARSGDLDAARDRDNAKNSPVMQSGLSTDRGAALARQLPADKAQTLAAQRTVTAMSLHAFPPSEEFTRSLSALREIHRKNRQLIAESQNVMHGRVNSKYRQLQHAQSDALVNNAGADEVEPEASIAARYEAQRHTIAEAMRKIAHQGIPHTRIVRNGIHAAVTKFIGELERQDSDEQALFGVALGPRPAVNLARSVLIQFERRTDDIAEFEKLKPAALCSCYAHDMFSDFLAELDDWNS